MRFTNDAGAFVLDGSGTLNLRNGLYNYSFNDQQVNVPINLGDSQFWAGLYAGMEVTDQVNLCWHQLLVRGTQTITSSGTIYSSGSVSLAGEQNGSPTVVCSGNASNTYTGKTTVYASDLILDKQSIDGAIQGDLAVYGNVRYESDNQIGNVPGELGERFDQDAVQRIRSSLSNDDSENLQLIYARIIETQEAAAGASVPLVVRMPLRGRVVKFRRAIQVEPNTEMAIAFDAKPTVSSRIKVGYLWTGGVFAALLVVFLAAGPIQQRYLSISEKLASHHTPDSDFNEMGDDDDDSTIEV